jgi:dihydrofolate synthase/folylpolyglutamate synthase
MDKAKKMTYQEAKNYLDNTSKSGIILGLQPIRNLLDELDNPQDTLRFVHLAGTNGKGSVLSYLASILKEANYKTGQYTSPPLISRREQLQINGKWITRERFVGLVNSVKGAIKRLEEKNMPMPTVYEIETAMAFLYFKEERCEIVILETGMGGRDDATNVVKNTLVAGFTSISLDHMSFLGETIEEIATVKAGIIKADSIVVSGIQQPSVLEIIQERAKNEAVDFVHVCKDEIGVLESTYHKQVFTYKSSSPLTITMAGSHQIENAAVALEIIYKLQGLGFDITWDDILTGLLNTNFFGRFSVIGDQPIFIVDGAHNENGVVKLKENIINLFPNQKITFIMGIYKDKKVDEIAKTVLPVAKAVYTLTLSNKQRTLTAIELKEICEKYNYGDKKLEITPCTSVYEAVELAMGNEGKDGVVIAFGSLSYLGDVDEAVKHILGARKEHS